MCGGGGGIPKGTPVQCPQFLWSVSVILGAVSFLESQGQAVRHCARQNRWGRGGGGGGGARAPLHPPLGETKAWPVYNARNSLRPPKGGGGSEEAPFPPPPPSSALTPYSDPRAGDLDVVWGPDSAQNCANRPEKGSDKTLNRWQYEAGSTGPLLPMSIRGDQQILNTQDPLEILIILCTVEPPSPCA